MGAKGWGDLCVRGVKMDWEDTLDIRQEQRAPTQRQRSLTVWAG